MLIRALAYGRRYQELYESGKSITEIKQMHKTSERTIYKYLNLAYLSPVIADSILEAKVPEGMDLQKLFKLASAHVDFDKQEQAYFG